MTAFKKILSGAVGLAAVATIASPAAAQYGYGSNYGYGNNGSGVIGAIIGALGGGYGQYSYGNYGYNQVSDRSAVDQCTNAVQGRLNGYGNRGYGNSAYGNGYGGNGYGNSNYGGAQIAGITRIERRNNGVTKIYGVAMSNAAYSGYNRGNGYNNGYGNGYGGYNNGYGGYNNGYGANNGYGNGYGNANRGNPDLNFDCKIDRYGRVVDVNVNRMNRYNSGDYYYGYRQGY